ncbi:MAG: GntR family transcriptional regulator [Desulfobacteraceae bacterium]|nr:MAG: GntR family transcriptional regulator [Desulfobacteraceae bacterium]
MQIKKEMLSSQAYRALKEMIANYRFSPGSRLNVEELAKELGVSRTPIWEAVRRLEQEGLITNIPNRGVFMVEMTLPMALHLYQVREVLEGLAGRLAAANMDGGMIRKMEKCIEALRKVVEAGDPIGYSKLDFTFHAMIYEACGNPFLQEILESIKNKMRPLVPLSKPTLSRGYEEHKRILEALKSGDPEKAEKALQQHNRGMQAQIRRVMNEGLLKPDNQREAP